MNNFALICAVLVALSLLVLLFPLFRAQRVQNDDLRRARYELHDSILAELASDVANGRLSQNEYQASIAEAEARLVAEVGLAKPVAEIAPRSRAATIVAIGLLLPLMAGLLYFKLGNPAALEPMNRQAAAPAAVMDAAKIEGMVKSLEAKLALEPDNTQGWLMLARSYRTLARYDDAVKAYEQAWPLVQKDSGEIARFAGSLAVKDNTFAGRPTQLLARALEMNASEPDALMLAGSAALQRGDREAALTWWNKLLDLLEPGSEDEKWLIEEIRIVKEQTASAPVEKK
ncbi:c-type cytochrome biogenesis protein CcmI [Chitinibacter bivalviorum]|uniref:C-type cytochrome biogenesis protein CcmI n=1 Tax=Chitinibacter bivalviorum TaxID=2739434 RepID=A0A7H9BHL3_9NEIS|nr:c-type cytochrome biogenesis protein CcmI [Chitinibacter bivalviorum]QLG87756.1 c-type cytochrome biogenesis protein CcmI [Chitinibacter bivalviorum]